MLELFEKAADIFFPKVCLGCGREGEYVCQACLYSIPLHREYICPFCQRLSYFGKTCSPCARSKHLDGAWIVCEYRQLVRQMVLLLKFKNVQELRPCFEYTLMRFFHTVIEPHSSRLSFDGIIPVPLHRVRLYFRGFNQSEILAQMIGQIIHTPVETDVLVKRRNTQRQAVLEKKERLDNLKNAFAVTNRSDGEGKTILLVDDVTTTGTTLEECAKTLKAAGAKIVWALVFARSL